MRAELDTTCQRLNVKVVNVLDPVINVLQDAIGQKAEARPGRQYVLNADYFSRIDAMHYVLAHDDGQAQPGMAEADVVLVGVSRSSKTPTCFYLANRGIKAANVPLVPNLPSPPGLEDMKCPVIGLTLAPEALIDIRRHRLRLIGGGSRRGDAAGQFRLHRRGRGQGRTALGAAVLQQPWLADDRRDPALDRGDGGDRAATDGGWHNRKAKAAEGSPCGTIRRVMRLCALPRADRSGLYAAAQSECSSAW